MLQYLDLPPGEVPTSRNKCKLNYLFLGGKYIFFCFLHETCIQRPEW
jgi:hypothetical protein